MNPPEMHSTDRSPPAAVEATPRRWRDRLLQHEGLNFVLTNRVPRVALTLAMGRLARIESAWFTRLGLAVWRAFTDLDLSEAEPQRWTSLRQVFTRRLKPGLRPVDVREAVLASPSDAFVVAEGVVTQGLLVQAKGLTYPLAELLGSADEAAAFEGGRYATLRLSSSMYHRFHAPCAARITHVRHIGGDAWNVNPAALKRVPLLYCRNERAVVRLQRQGEAVGAGETVLLVPVAAILVASLRLHALDANLGLRWGGPNEIPCDRAVARGEELGWFEHGSTIVVLTLPGHAPAPGVVVGARLKMGQALFQRGG